MADLSLANTVNQFEEERKKKEELERQRRESFDQTKIDEANKIANENEMQGWDYLSYNKKEEFGNYLNNKYGKVSRLEWGKLYNMKLMQDSLGLDQFNDYYRKGLMTSENIDNLLNQHNGKVLKAQFDTILSQFKNPETGQYEGLDATTEKTVSLFDICDNNKKQEIINMFKKAAELDKPRQEAFAKSKQLIALKDEKLELEKDPTSNHNAIEEKAKQIKQLEDNIENLQDDYGDTNWFEDKIEWVKDLWNGEDHNMSEVRRRGYSVGSIKSANINKETYIDTALNYEKISDLKKEIARIEKLLETQDSDTDNAYNEALRMSAGKSMYVLQDRKTELQKQLEHNKKQLQTLENNLLGSNANHVAENNDHIKRANEAMTLTLNNEALKFADKTKGQVQEYLEQSEYKSMSGEDLDSAFEQAINEDGNSVYQSYWRTRNNEGSFFGGDYGTEVMKNFSDSDKREYLASRDFYNQALGNTGANALLAAQAQDYIASHQTDLQKNYLNSKSIVVGLASNGADIMNGVRLGMLQAMDINGVKVDVCVDADNNIYSPDDIIQLPGAEGKMFVKNENGENIEVHQTKMSPTQLDALGYDWTDIKQRRSVFNQQYWMKAENYNTFDSKEMDAVDESGGMSAYNAQYENGKRRSIIWDATTNAIIGLTDVAMLYFSGGSSFALKFAAAGSKGAQFMRVAKAAGGVEKLLSAGYKGLKVAPTGNVAKVAKATQFLDKVNPTSKILKAQSVTSTMYSGQRYSFAAAYQQNLEMLNQKVMNDAQKMLSDELSTSEGMQSYNQEINNRYMKALQETGLGNLGGGASELGQSDPDTDAKRQQLYSQIKQQYDQERYQKAINDVKNTQEYADAFSSASGQATNIAIMSSFTSGLENLIVANAVFRKGIYDSVEDMTKQTMSRQAGKGIYTRMPDGSFKFNNRLFKEDGSKNRWNRFKDFTGITAKTVGFEMGVGYSQSVFMNAGKGNYTAFDDYLMNHYGEDITADTYTGIGAGQAFLNGIAMGLGDEENLRQGLAGIGSFAVNPFNIGWGAGTMLYEGHKIRKGELVKEHAAYQAKVAERTAQLKKEGKSDVDIEQIIKQETKEKSGLFSTESTLENTGFHPFQSARRWLAHSKVPIVNYISAYRTQHSTLEMASQVWRNNILSTYVSDVNAERMLKAQFDMNYQLAQGNGELLRSMMHIAALTNVTQAGQSKDEADIAKQLMAMEAIRSIERRTQNGDIAENVSLGDAMRSQMFADYLGGLINGANKGWDNLSAKEQEDMVTEYITRKNLGDSKNEETRKKVSEIVKENLNNWATTYNRYKEAHAKVEETEKQYGRKLESVYKDELLKHYTLDDIYTQSINNIRERLQKIASEKGLRLPKLDCTDSEGRVFRLYGSKKTLTARKQDTITERNVLASQLADIDQKIETLHEEEKTLLKTINDNSHWYNNKKANAARHDAMKALHKNKVERGKLSRLGRSIEGQHQSLQKKIDVLDKALEKYAEYKETEDQVNHVSNHIFDTDVNWLDVHSFVELISTNRSEFSKASQPIIDKAIKTFEDAGVLDDLLLLERTIRRQQWSQSRISEMRSDVRLETVLLKEAEERNSESAQVKHIVDVIINGVNAYEGARQQAAYTEFQNRANSARQEKAQVDEQKRQMIKRISKLNKKKAAGTITKEEKQELARYKRSEYGALRKKSKQLQKDIDYYTGPEKEIHSEDEVNSAGEIVSTRTRIPDEVQRRNEEIRELGRKLAENEDLEGKFEAQCIKSLSELYLQFGPDLVKAAIKRAEIYLEAHDKGLRFGIRTTLLDRVKMKAEAHSLLLDSFMDAGLRDGDSMATVITTLLGESTTADGYVARLTEIADTYIKEARGAKNSNARKEALDKARLVAKVLERFQHYLTIKSATTNPDPMQTPSHKEKLNKARREFTKVEDSLRTLSKCVDKAKTAFKKAKTDAEKESAAKQLAQYLNDYNEVWYAFYDGLDSNVKKDEKNPTNGRKFKKRRAEVMSDINKLLQKHGFEIQDPDYTEQSIRLSLDEESGTLPNGSKVRVGEMIVEYGDKPSSTVQAMKKVGLKHGDTVIQEVTVSVRRTFVKESTDSEVVQNILDNIDEVQELPIQNPDPEPVKDNEQGKKDNEDKESQNEPPSPKEPESVSTDFWADDYDPSKSEDPVADLNYWMSVYFDNKEKASFDVADDKTIDVIMEAKKKFAKAKGVLQKFKELGYKVSKSANEGALYEEKYGGTVHYEDTSVPMLHGKIKKVSKLVIQKDGEVLQEPEFVVYRCPAEEQKLQQEQHEREQEALDALSETPATPLPEVNDPEGSRTALADQIAQKQAEQQLKTNPDENNPNGLPSGESKPQTIVDDITGDTTTKITISDSEGKTTEVTIIKPADSDSNDLGNNGVKTNDEGEVMLGNTFYKYDATSLEASNGRAAVPRKGNSTGTLDNYMNWQKDNNTDIQSIIDVALPEIHASDPNVKIHFMYSNDPLLKDRGGNAHTMLCIEYSGKTKEVYDKYKDRYGGIVRAQDGKEYLIVGVMGFAMNKTGMTSFNQLRAMHALNSDYEAWKTSNSEGVFVIPDSYTTITDEGIQSGRLRRSDGSTEPKQRPLQELLDSSESNPENIKSGDLILGYVSSDGQLVIPGVKKGVRIAPLRHQGDQLNAGSNFIIVNKAGKRVPIFIPTPKTADIFSLKNDRIETKIPNLTRYLNDYIYRAVGEDGSWNSNVVLNLQEFLLKTFNLDKNGVEIWLGSDSERVFEIKNHGRSILKGNVADLKYNIGSLCEALKNSGAIVRMPDNFTGSNSWWVSSGLITTDVDCLTTVNKGFGINPVNSDGTPKHVSLSKRIASKKSDTQLSDDHATGQYLSIAGTKYRRFTEGSRIVWKSESGEEVTNQEDIRNLDISFYRYNYNNPYPAIRFTEVEAAIPAGEKVGKAKKNEVTANYEYYILPNCPYKDSKKGDLWRLNKTTGEWTQLSMDAYNMYKAASAPQSSPKQSPSKPLSQNTAPKKKEGKIPNNTKAQVDATITRMTNPEQEFHLYDDPQHPELKDKYYVDKDGKKYCRVTATKEGYDSSMKFVPDPQKDYKTPSTTLGNSVDRFNRDFHKGLIKTKDQIREDLTERYINDTLKSAENKDKSPAEKEALATKIKEDALQGKYPEITEQVDKAYDQQCAKFEESYPAATRQDWENYLGQIAKNDAKEEWVDSDGITHKMYRAVTDDIHAFGEIEVVDAQGNKYTLPVCGVIDKLMIDDAGNYHLRDFKTRRENKVTDFNKKAWAFQLRMYKDFLEKEYGIHIKTCQIEMTYWDGRFEGSKGYPTKPEGSWKMEEVKQGQDKIQTLYLDNEKFTAKPVASSERIDLTADVNAFDTPEGNQRVYHYENFPKEYQELCVPRDGKAKNASQPTQADNAFVSNGIPKSMKKQKSLMSIVSRMTEQQKIDLLTKIGNEDILNTFLQSKEGILKLETLARNILDC